MSEEPIAKTMLAFVDEIDRDVERWALDRAYMVAGGPFLAVAHRLGWPAADRALSFVMAVRKLANLNSQPPQGSTATRDRDRAFEHYRQQRDDVRKWLTGG